MRFPAGRGRRVVPLRAGFRFSGHPLPVRWRCSPRWLFSRNRPSGWCTQLPSCTGPRCFLPGTSDSPMLSTLITHALPCVSKHQDTGLYRSTVADGSCGLDDWHRHFGENLPGDVHSSDATNLCLGLEDDSVAEDLQGDALDVVRNHIVAAIDCGSGPR